MRQSPGGAGAGDESESEERKEVHVEGCFGLIWVGGFVNWLVVALLIVDDCR